MHLKQEYVYIKRVKNDTKKILKFVRFYLVNKENRKQRGKTS